METEKYKGCVIKIEQDSDAESPRQWDNLGTMVCFHRRYNLGDKHNLSIDEAKKLETDPRFITLPLYLFDHSGITMSTTPFNCPWDSGKVGFIYVSKKKVLKEYRKKNISKKLLAQVKEVLIGEVKTYDAFITGSVYGYIAETIDGRHIDSCWGFIETDQKDRDYMVGEAKSSIDHFLAEREKQDNQVKNLYVG